MRTKYRFIHKSGILCPDKLRAYGKKFFVSWGYYEKISDYRFEWGAGRGRIEECLLMKNTMRFLSLQPFVPSGKDLEKSKQLFREWGFEIQWDAGDHTGFQKGKCKFILQKFGNKVFAENSMITVAVSNAGEFRKEMK